MAERYFFSTVCSPIASFPNFCEKIVKKDLTSLRNYFSRELLEEEERVLKCRHAFHSECIAGWLKIKHNCPLCRARLEVDTPEVPRPEMSAEEILAVPDHALDHNLQLNLGRAQVRSETPVARTASRVNSVASRIFWSR